jgi:single-strand DNA-binding protein
VNSITLVGNLAADPTPRPIGTGSACRLRLAVDRRSQSEALFVDVDTFGPLAETCAKHLAKGRLVAVHGRLDHESWRTSDGQPRSRHYVIASSVEFLDHPTG